MMASAWSDLRSHRYSLKKISAMPHPLLLLACLVLALTAATAEEARRAKPGELSGLQAAPTAKAPKFISKSVTGGPPTERSREYVPKSATSAKSAVVRINLSDGSTKEEPFIEIPLLFRVGTTELLDRNSRANLDDAIAEVRKVLAASPEACFRVEGHASAEGDGTANERLASARAAAIQQTLSRSLQANAALRAEGRGIRDAKARATDAEAMLQQDRRVLVVREK